MPLLKFKDKDGQWQVVTGTSNVVSFNGRAGAIKPQMGDYTAEMVGAVPVGEDGKVPSEFLPEMDYADNEALNAHINDVTNPHNVTADQVQVTEEVLNAFKETTQMSVADILATVGIGLFSSEPTYRWNKTGYQLMNRSSNDYIMLGGFTGKLYDTVYYSDAYTVSGDGLISLVNPVAFTVNFVDETPLPDLVGKWITGTNNPTNVIYKGKKDVRFEYLNDTTNYPTVYDLERWVWEYGTVIVASEDPNAHYDGEVDADGYTYTALDPISGGIARMQTQSYAGTDTPEFSVAFPFEPEAIILFGTGYIGAIRSTLLFWVKGMTKCLTIYGNYDKPSVSDSYVTATVDGTVMNFAPSSSASTTPAANHKNITYYVIAFSTGGSN